jgi:transcriptional regulator with AAA-type ATPase domain/transcriptional regulatory protein LevR
MTRKQTIYEFLRRMKSQHGMDAVYSTEEIANAVGASRANVSSDLNRLFEEQLVEKLPGWPVKYRASSALLTPIPTEKSRTALADADAVFDCFVGHNGSMSMEIEKAKAAVLYPLNGLPLLIGGKTGVGKTTFAKLLYEYAKRAKRIGPEAQFVSFNCADYSNNPQLIMAQLFGYARGAYTGADDEHAGLVETADGGVLFLDEVHRLPETAQEMLFFLMDFSQYRRLGEADTTRTSHPIIIMATTENKDSALLATFNRRIPISVTLPALADRSPFERFQLIQQLFQNEAAKLKLDLRADALTVKALLAYDCPGNVGQLENDIRVACARAYVECLMGRQTHLSIGITDFPFHVKDGLRQIRSVYSDINLIARDLDIRVQDADCAAQPQEAFVSGGRETDIYDLLARQYQAFAQNIQDKETLELAMTLDIESYIRELMERHDGENCKMFVEFLSKQAVDVAQKADAIIKCELGITLEERYKKIIAMHLDTAISRVEAKKPIVCPVLNRIQEGQPQFFDAAKQIVLYMRNECGLEMPDDEIGFFANLLCRLVSDAGSTEHGGVLVLCHGLGSASTMAKVANTVLGRNFVCWLDLTDQQSDDSIRLAVEAKLDEMSGCSSYLVLTDATVLAELCTSIGQKIETPLYALDNISTSMVIEASMLVSEKHASAQQVYHHLKQFERSYNKLFEVETAKLVAGGQKRVIVTACISGCGAAVKLKKIISDTFELPPDIEIVTMDIASIDALKNRIFELSCVRNILCIVGMDVGLELSFPFISIEEFVLGNGMQRLSGILSNYNICHRENVGEQALPQSASAFEDAFYTGRYLSGYLFYLDADKMLPYLKQATRDIEASRGEMHEGKRIMLGIHLCSMVERLVFDCPQKNKPAPNPPADLLDAFGPLSSVYHIDIPQEEYDMIEQILNLVLDK